MKFGLLKISDRHEIFISFILITIIALSIRFVLMPFESEDVRVFMIWLMNIKAHGISNVLNQTGALFLYNPPFMYLLSIGSLLPSWVPDVVVVKLVSIPFEIITAYFSAKIIKKLGHGDLAALLVYALVLLLPTILLDGAVWGQSDAIFTSFIVLSVYFLCQEKPLWSMVAFGLSLSFKLQSMVFAPAIICFLLVGKIRIRDLAVIPIVYLAMLIPSAIAGRDIVSLLTIYGGQAETYRNITINAPNLYIWFSDGNLYKWIPDSLFFILKSLAYLLTITFVLFITSSVRFSRVQIKSQEIVLISFISALISPFLLPMMHERYFYVADILSLLFVFSATRMFYIPILLQSASVYSYLSFLIFRFTMSNEELMSRTQTASVIMTFVVVIMIREFYLRLYCAKESEAIENKSNQMTNIFLPSQRTALASSGCFLIFLIWTIISYHPSIIASTLYLPVTKEPITNSDGLVDISYLDHLRASSFTQGWGIPYFDADLRGYPLIVNGKQSRKSICVHAASTITYDINQKFSHLMGSIGFPDYLDRKTAPTSVIYEIIGDSTVLWSSQVLRPSSIPEGFKIDVSNIKKLVLKVTDAGNGIDFDHACWVNISLQP